MRAWKCAGVYEYACACVARTCFQKVMHIFIIFFKLFVNVAVAIAPFVIFSAISLLVVLVGVLLLLTTVTMVVVVVVVAVLFVCCLLFCRVLNFIR